MINIIKGTKIKTYHIYINNIMIIVTSIKIHNNECIKGYNNNNIIRKEKKQVIGITSINNIIRIICFSKGKGFCGTIKRYKFLSNRASHGNSKAHNKPGSIGMCQTPGRILKGKKMAGRMGNNKKTIKYPKIIYQKKTLIIIKGIILGKNNSIITILY